MSRAALAEWWAGRLPRERALLLAGSAVLGVLGLYWFVVQPLSVAGERAARALPALRAQTSEMQALAKEVQRLRQLASVASPAADIASLNASVVSGGFAARITAQGEGAYVLTAEGVSPVVLTRWLAEVRNRYRLHVRSARLSADSAGRASVQLVLAP